MGGMANISSLGTSQTGGFFGSSGASPAAQQPAQAPTQTPLPAASGSPPPQSSGFSKGFQPSSAPQGNANVGQNGQRPTQYLNPAATSYGYQVNPLIGMLLSAAFSGGYGFKDGGAVSEEDRQKEIEKAIELAKKILEKE